MNYFERLVRRALCRPPPAADQPLYDPFENQAPWPMEVGETPLSVPESGSRAGAPRVLSPVSEPLIDPRGPKPVPSPDAPLASASQPVPDLARGRVQTPSPARSAPPLPAAQSPLAAPLPQTRRAQSAQEPEAGPQPPQQMADAFMQSLGNPLDPPDSPPIQSIGPTRPVPEARVREPSPGQVQETAEVHRPAPTRSLVPPKDSPPSFVAPGPAHTRRQEPARQVEEPAGPDERPRRPDGAQPRALPPRILVKVPESARSGTESGASPATRFGIGQL